MLQNLEVLRNQGGEGACSKVQGKEKTQLNLSLFAFLLHTGRLPNSCMYSELCFPLPDLRPQHSALTHTLCQNHRRVAETHGRFSVLNFLYFSAAFDMLEAPFPLKPPPPLYLPLPLSSPFSLTGWASSPLLSLASL